MAYDVGTAVIHVNVAFEGIEQQLRNLAEKIGKDLNAKVSDGLNEGVSDGLDRATQRAGQAAKRGGARVGKDVGDGVAKGVANGVAKGIVDGVRGGLDDALNDGERAWRTWENNLAHTISGAYALRVRQAAERVFRDMPTFQQGVDIGPGTEQLRAVRNQILELVNGSPDFLISEEGLARLKELRSELAKLSKDAEAPRQIRVDAETGLRTIDGLFRAIETRSEESVRIQAEREKELRVAAARKTAEAARKVYDDWQRGANKAVLDLERERQRAIELQLQREEKLRIAGATKAAREAQKIYEDYERAVARAAADATKERERAAKAAFDRQQQTAVAVVKFFDKINQDAAREAERLAARSAKATEDAFNSTLAGRIRKVFTDAYRQIPDLDVDANTEPAARALLDLRRQIETLSGARVGVDLSAREALAQIAVLKEQLRELAATSPTIEVRAAAVGAYNELVRVERLAKDLDGRNVRIDVFADGRSATSALAGVAANAEVTLHRLGALIVTSSSLGTAIVPAAAAAAGAIGTIGTAAVAAAAGIGVLILGFSGIGDALKAMDAHAKDLDKSQASLARSAGQVASATDAVRSAERGLANTRASNASAFRRAAQAVEDAERGIARAQEQARQATLDLIRAREEERRANQDLAFDLEGTSIAQRQAALDQAEAKRDLDRILANPRATEEQKEAARIAYDEISLRVRELAVQHQRLTAEQRTANKNGIEGSDRVVAAKRRERDAVQGVQDAQRRLAEAVIAQADQQRQAVFAVAQAQQTLASAQRQLQQATSSQNLAGLETLDTLKERMEALSPAGRTFVAFLYSLKKPIQELRAAAQEGLLPGVQRAIETVLPYLPGFSKWVGKVATATGLLFEKTADLLTNDESWQRFWGYVGKETIPMLFTLWEIGSNLATAMINLFMAFTPFNEPVGGGLVEMTKRFAEWSKTLDTNTGFQKFLEYVRENGPRVIEFLGRAAVLLGRFVAAAAPIGVIVIEVLTKLFEWINKIPVDVLTILIATIAGVAAAIGLFAAATAIATASTAALVIAGIGALVAALLVLWNTVEPVRTAVTTVFDAIGSVVSWVYENRIRPALDGIGWLIEERVAPLFSWLYHNIIDPIWDGISLAFKIGFSVIQVAFGLFQIWVKIAGLVWAGLYKIYIKPIWDLVRPVFMAFAGIWFSHILPAVRSGVSAVGKAWSELVELSKTPIRFIVETILNNGLLKGYNTIAKAFKVKPDNVHIDLKGFARGGAIGGWGTGTSDDNIIRASRGEHMWTAREVRAAGGHQRVHQLRQAVLDGTLPAFRDGGPIGDGIGDLFNRLKKKAGDVWEGVTDFLSDPAGTLRKLTDKLIKLVPGDFADSDFGRAALGVPRSIAEAAIDKVKNLFSGEDGGPVSGGGIGSAQMMRLLRAQFPGLSLYSGYRPGAVTSSGNRSWHSVNRAVDVPPRRDVFSWIHDNFFKVTKELIWGGDPSRNIQNGRYHRFSDSLLRAHGPYKGVAGSSPHVHWAYDSGGMLPTGVSTVVNNTGRPEAVLSPSQWNMMAALARNAHAEPRQNVFHFQQATLDLGRLRAIEDRQNAQARVGRPG
ncbi:hypothetical protein I0C86_41500 [Plantactinospora sp. S1510]|uniref:Phage-related protein n=1 Tax=Plantactinospora alkalitolerans TaxID=2789879 RepID=A0ABS0HAG1_9ACTN|nr:hypothetical protein [Plantactinospora alkalitolerans]MBF9135329.1 hypothetical protein [Plantactinospora alkalitolerans]